MTGWRSKGAELGPPTEVGKGLVESVRRKFASDGYTVLRELVPTGIADRAREEIIGLAAGDGMPQQYSTRLGRHIVGQHRVTGVVSDAPSVGDLVFHPVVVGVVRALIGEDARLSTCSGNILDPGFEQLDWHVDHPYWDSKPPWLKGDIAIAAVWALDDFRIDNGSTAVVAGSHRYHAMPLRRDQPIEGSTTVTAKRGSVLLFQPTLWHSSTANYSRAPRCALLSTYMKQVFTPMEHLAGHCAGALVP